MAGVGQMKIALDIIEKGRTFASPYFARACGRVSVGGDPDKRPVNRLKKDQ